MHASDPAGQIARARAGDEACLSCHEDKRAILAEHTHHPASSRASACVSCHMPKTTYALLKAIRSHRIDSPGAEGTNEGARPSACNLCHIDRTRQWTSTWLGAWSGRRARAADARDAGRRVGGARRRRPLRSFAATRPRG